MLFFYLFFSSEFEIRIRTDEMKQHKLYNTQLIDLTENLLKKQILYNVQNIDEFDKYLIEFCFLLLFFCVKLKWILSIFGFIIISDWLSSRTSLYRAKYLK